MNFEIVNIHTHSPFEWELTPRCWGVHPWDALGQWRPLTPPTDIEAVGEIGLDSRCDIPIQSQIPLFEEQLQITQRVGLPVILHCVGCFERVVGMLKRYTLNGVIFHGFIGSPQQAQEALKRGYYLSFGELTLRSPKSCEALRVTPLERLFVETDVSSTPIEQIYFRLAEIKGCNTEDLKIATRNNFRTIFGR